MADIDAIRARLAEYDDALRAWLDDDDAPFPPVKAARRKVNDHAPEDIDLLLKQFDALRSEFTLLVETQREMAPVSPNDDPYSLGFKSAWETVASIARRALGEDHE